MIYCIYDTVYMGFVFPVFGGEMTRKQRLLRTVMSVLKKTGKTKKQLFSSICEFLGLQKKARDKAKKFSSHPGGMAINFDVPPGELDLNEKAFTIGNPLSAIKERISDGESFFV